MSVRALLKGGWLVTMVPGSEPARGDLLIDDDRIAALGQLDDVSEADVVDAREHIVLPGLGFLDDGYRLASPLKATSRGTGRTFASP